jgi:hypothetical protein
LVERGESAIGSVSVLRVKPHPRFCMKLEQRAAGQRTSESGRARCISGLVVLSIVSLKTRRVHESNYNDAHRGYGPAVV